jgi:hypothetical protein
MPTDDIQVLDPEDSTNNAQLVEDGTLNKVRIKDMPEDIQNQILEWYMADLSPRKISLQLRGKGYEIDHVSVWRWVNARLKCSQDNEPFSDEELRKLEKKTIQKTLFLLGEALNKVSKVPEVTCMKDLEMLVSAQAKIIAANSQKVKAELEGEAIIRKVQELMKAEVRQLLARQPELVTQVQALVDEASERIILAQ